MTIYAIGDVHGHLDKLLRALDRVEADRAREGTQGAELIQVGDMIDRGPDSKGVVEHMMQLSASDPRVTVLRGNHDQYMIDFLLQDFDAVQASGGLRWLDGNIGGRETLVSYGIRNWRASAAHRAAQRHVPMDHVRFMADLPYSHTAGDCFFVHAGIRPGVPLDDQSEIDMLWIRSDFLLSKTDHGPLVVHGHTPTDEVMHMGNRLAIDTGAGFDGPLSAVAIEGRDAFLLTDQGRVRVT